MFRPLLRSLVQLFSSSPAWGEYKNKDIRGEYKYKDIRGEYKYKGIRGEYKGSPGPDSSIPILVDHNVVTESVILTHCHFRKRRQEFHTLAMFKMVSLRTKILTTIPVTITTMNMNSWTSLPIFFCHQLLLLGMPLCAEEEERKSGEEEKEENGRNEQRQENSPVDQVSLAPRNRTHKSETVKVSGVLADCPAMSFVFVC